VQDSTNALFELEEFTVTVRRREEKAQTVPIAVSVFSQRALQDNNIQTLADLQYLVPSMSADAGSTFTRDTVNLSIRGQGRNSLISQPGVLVYLNEVPIPNDNFGDFAGGPGLLFDLENVQVLKGPQGTLFGRNSSGGAVLLQTARPTNEFGGRAQLGYGNFNNREFDAALNLPIVSDRLLTRIAFNGQRREGFTDVLGSAGRFDADTRDNWSVRGSAVFHPNDRLDNTLVVTYQEYESDGSPWVLTAVNLDPNGCGPALPLCAAPLLFPGFAAAAAEQAARGIRTVAADASLLSKGRNFAVSNITRIDLNGNLTFRNIMGYNEANTAVALDEDASPFPIFHDPSAPRNETVRQLTEEAQLLGKAFGGRLDWITGAFYLEQPRPDEFVRRAMVVFGGPVETAEKRADRSKALYAQGSYDLSSLLQGFGVTAGLRYTWDDRFSCTYPGPVASAQCDLFAKQSQSSALTWTFDLTYQTTPDTLLYAGARRGYRAGGANGLDADGNELPDFGPEYVNDVEFGIKSDWRIANFPIRTNAAIYYQDYTDIQVQHFTLVDDDLVQLTANAAAATLWGAELEAQLQLTSNLQLRVTFDRLSLDYRDVGADVADPVGLERSRTYNRPPYKYGVEARYRLPLAPQIGSVSVQGNWHRQDESGDALLTNGGRVPAFSLLNLAVNWDEIAGRPWDASLYVSNLTNERYVLGGFGLSQLLGWDIYRFGAPRMYGLRLRYQFSAARGP
jgi:iron complex outermembrane receptor protein